MKPLWKINSGEFAGWRSKNGQLYNRDGEHVGFFDRKVAYSLEGRYVGELEGEKWLGKKPKKPPTKKTPKTQRAAIKKTPLPDRDGQVRSGWEDPDL
ncbi:MAG: hypothetical protein R6U57_02815 [Anaerolineales bacterium]